MLVVVELLVVATILTVAVVRVSILVGLGRNGIVGLAVDLIGDSFPYCVDALLIVEAFKNSIAADHEEVEVVLQFETLDFWLAHDDILVATVLLLLRFDVSKSP